MNTLHIRRAASALIAAGTLVAAPAFADSTFSPTPECGGDKSGKEVNKPKGDEDKRPTNPASVTPLCGGDKSGKEVNKPKGDEDKRPTNPASVTPLCGDDKSGKEVNKPKGDEGKRPTNPA